MCMHAGEKILAATEVGVLSTGVDL
uniref:Uncharacterized protein n=1 Tax=Arundo donax TaxID=35708 RepID=A0A0A9U0L3_ARUDO